MALPLSLPLVIRRGITFLGFKILCSNNGSPVNLTGWQVFAIARSNAGQMIDLQPSISNAAQGEITVPEITFINTMALTAGNYQWDFVLETPAGQRLDPILAGELSVRDVQTRPPVTP